MFHLVRGIARIFNRRCTFYALEELKEPSIIISNHNFPRGPTKWSYYFPYGNFKIWANSEFCYSIKRAFIALKKTMIRNGKSKFWASFCSFWAAPFLRFGFKFSPVIPCFIDMRFYITISKSVEQFEAGNHIVLFPDCILDPFSYEVKNIQPGFLILARQLKAKGYDPNIVTAQSDKKRKMVLLNKPVKLSEIEKKFDNDKDILQYFQNDINHLLINNGISLKH